ncbi:MAG: NUDIX domain-containing protein [Acidobacteriota bacterium]|nr:NUDIX domain-containing protein [Acidobacteriota bacterium]
MKESAGVLVYRRRPALEVLLVHPGGPFWRNKDAGAWTIPKGELAAGEDPRACALRELREETGLAIDGPVVELDTITQKGGKRVRAFAAESDFDPSGLTSNTFDMEWPPRSGRRQTFPEVDRAEWFGPDAAREKINAAQAALIDSLIRHVSAAAAREPAPPGAAPHG